MKQSDYEVARAELTDLERNYGNDSGEFKEFERLVKRIDMSKFSDATAQYCQWDNNAGEQKIFPAKIRNAKATTVAHGEPGAKYRMQGKILIEGVVDFGKHAKELPVQGFLHDGKPANCFYKIVFDEAKKSKEA